MGFDAAPRMSHAVRADGRRRGARTAQWRVVFIGIGLEPRLQPRPRDPCPEPRPDLRVGRDQAAPERLPGASATRPRHGPLMVCGMVDVFQSLLQNGRIEVGFLGGANRSLRQHGTTVGIVPAPGVRSQRNAIAIPTRTVVSRLSPRAFPETVDHHQPRSPGARTHAPRARLPGAGQ
jgi:glutaconate CoA-transferase subunit B